MRAISEVIKSLDENGAETMIRWRKYPEEFFEDVIRAKPMDWQIKLIRAIALAKQGLPNREDGKCLTRFAVKSGTGVGKTFCVSGIILWMLACFPDCKIPCTAPTSPQIKAVLWPELRKLSFMIPDGLKPYFPFDVQTDKVVIHDNFAVARTAREENPEAFQGFHNTNIALIGDEASGIPDPIYMAGQGIMSEAGAITLLIGNPTRPTGYFFDCFHTDSAKWWTLTVSCEDSPRVTRDYINDMREKHGENSYEFRVRVMGEFHLEDSGLIIPRPWIDEAVERDVSPNSDYIIWGVDVSDGRDKSALAKRMGNILLEAPRAWGGKELMQSVGIVVDEYYNTKNTQMPDEICIDAIGMGTGFVQRLREALAGEPVKITGVNVALTGSQVNQRFTSRRVELWDRGRKWFESAVCSIPKGCNELAAQLSSVEWEVKDSNGKWAILDKSAGVGHSPDVADAFLLTFGGVKGDKNSFTKKQSGSIFKRNNGANEFGITSASYLQRG